VRYLKEHPEVVKALAPEIGEILDKVRRLCTINCVANFVLIWFSS